MTRDEKYINLLSTIAEDDVGTTAKLAAAIVYQNKVVSIGKNKYKSDPLQARFGKNSEAIYIHAEIDAIKNALKRVSLNDLSKCTMYVVRVKRTKRGGDYVNGISKPCSGCQRAITTFGIKRVVYLNEEKEMHELVN